MLQEGVSRVLLGCFIGVYRVIQRYLMGIFRVLKGSFRVIKESFKNISRKFLGSVNSILMVFQESFEVQGCFSSGFKGV